MAVWVGFIALFGTAVQTAVVMVIYLEEAVARKAARTGRGVSDACSTFREAVIEGALLTAAPRGDDGLDYHRRAAPHHVEPKSRGASKVIKPLATPVLGGMVSSLIHVLIVTPVIFLWLRERELRKATSKQPPQSHNKEISTQSHTVHLFWFPGCSRRRFPACR